jgi:hypothetical protein
MCFEAIVKAESSVIDDAFACAVEWTDSPPHVEWIRKSVRSGGVLD